jgi:hypothetical protein
MLGDIKIAKELRFHFTLFIMGSSFNQRKKKLSLAFELNTIIALLLLFILNRFFANAKVPRFILFEH